MKTPAKYIQIHQGPTTAVYTFRHSGICAGVIITHKDPTPMLFTRKPIKRI